MTKQIAFIYTETNGLHKKMSYRSVDAKNLHTWARLVAVYYQIGHRDAETKKIKITKKNKFIIKPEDFIINDQSIAIHNIDNEIADSQGTDIKVVLNQLKDDLNDVDNIVCHNLDFHLRALQAECFRHKIYINFGKSIMIDIMNFYHKIDYPKLEELTFELVKKNYDNKPRSYKVIMVKKCFDKLYSLHEKKCEKV
jgi:DNA polymerase III epsilon subunit-like protein